MNSFHSKEEEVYLNSSDTFEILNIQINNEQYARQEQERNNIKILQNAQKSTLKNDSNSPSQINIQKNQSSLSKGLADMKIASKNQSQVNEKPLENKFEMKNHSSVASDHSEQHPKRKLSDEQTDFFQNLRKSIDDENYNQSNPNKKRKNSVEVCFQNSNRSKKQITKRQPQIDFQIIIKSQSDFKKDYLKSQEKGTQKQFKRIKELSKQNSKQKACKKQLNSNQGIVQMELSCEQKVQLNEGSDPQISINPIAFSTALHNVISIIEKGTESQVFASKGEWQRLFRTQSCDDYKSLSTIIKMRRKSARNANKNQDQDQNAQNLKNQKNLTYFWQIILKKVNFLNNLNSYKQNHQFDSTKIIVWKRPKITNFRAIKLIDKAMVKIKQNFSGFFSVKDQSFQRYVEWVQRFLNQYSSLDIEVGYSKGLEYLPMAILLAYPDTLTYDTLKQITIYLLTFWNIRKLYLPGSPLLFSQIEKIQLSINQKIVQKLKRQNADFTRVFINYFRTIMFFKLSNQKQKIGAILFQFIQKIVHLLLIDGINVVTVMLVRMINIRKDKILNLIEQENRTSHDPTQNQVNMKKKEDILNYVSQNVVTDFLLQKIEEGKNIDQIFNDILIINQ